MTKQEKQPTSQKNLRSASSELSPAAKAARSAYTKEYRRKHPEKVAAWNKAHWERRAAMLAQAAPDPEVSED